MTKTKIDIELAKSVMEKINQGLDGDNSEWIEGRKENRNRDKPNGELKPDLSDTNAVLNAILKAVLSLLSQNNELTEQKKLVKDLEEKNRAQGDLLDEIQQRSFKGGLIITSPEGKNKVSCVKSQEELRKEKKTVTDHACELLRRKYDVIVPPSDISACHHLQSKNILVKIWNRKEGSAWEKLSNQIMKGGRKEENIYANYMMTSMRNNIMFELRKLKRDGLVEKIFSDENGKISIKVHEKSSKQPISFFAEEKFGICKTLSINEIKDLVKNAKAK